MPVSLLLRKKFERFDDIIIDLSRKLFAKFGELIVRVESFDDGPAVRIFVREKNWDIVNSIVEAVRNFERERNLKTPIIVHIDDIDEYPGKEEYFLEPKILTEISKYLKNLLGRIIVRVESFDDGPAVRIFVREKNWDIINSIVEAVRNFERERNLKTPIIVHIDDIDEV